jgi:pimeloyl-ACP methyl ester carboxylesterase
MQELFTECIGDGETFEGEARSIDRRAEVSPEEGGAGGGGGASARRVVVDRHGVRITLSNLFANGYAARVRFLYLHGFASGPRSTKGLKFAAHFAMKGIAIDRLDLRVPSFEHLRVSEMIEVAENAIGRADEQAIVFGSSLGGLTAARLAERDPRVKALVLLAPAFQIVERWKLALGDGFTEWERTGWREVMDFTTGQPARVDFGFVEDARAIDVGFPDVRVPTLIMHGVNDDVVPIDHSRRFAADRPHVQLIELEDGHDLVASIPRLLAESEAFLSKVTALS